MAKVLAKLGSSTAVYDTILDCTVAKELDKPDGCHRFGKCCQKLGKDLPAIQTNIHPARILELNGHNWQKLPIY